MIQMSHWQRIKCILLVSLIASTSGNLLNPSKCCSEVKTTGGYNGRFQRSTLKGGEEVLLDESSTSTSYITYDGDVWKLIVLGGWATTYKAYAHADCPETAGSEHFKDLASGEFVRVTCVAGVSLAWGAIMAVCVTILGLLVVIILIFRCRQQSAQPLATTTPRTTSITTPRTHMVTTPYPPLQSTPSYPPLQSTPPYPPLQSTPPYPPLQSTPSYPPLQSTPSYPPLQSTPPYPPLHATALPQQPPVATHPYPPNQSSRGLALNLPPVSARGASPSQPTPPPAYAMDPPPYSEAILMDTLKE